MSFGDTTCESLGNAGGILSCNPQCQIVDTGCEPITCNRDGIVNGNEQCDVGRNGPVFKNGADSCMGHDSSTFSMGGTLNCVDCVIDTKMCVQIGCGNGVVEGDEDCDLNFVSKKDGPTN